MPKYNKQYHFRVSFLKNFNLLSFYQSSCRVGHIHHFHKSARNQVYTTIIYRYKGICTSLHIKKTELKKIQPGKSYRGLCTVKKGLL